MFKIRTWEPGPVLGNLDLNKTLVEDPYSGTWIRTREPGPILVYVLKMFFCLSYSEYINEYRLRSWPNIDGTYGT